MTSKTFTALTTLALLFAPACKSKEEKCTSACERIEKEELAKCAGDQSCEATVRSTTKSCLGLCGTAFGDRNDEGEGPTKTARLSPTERLEEDCLTKKDGHACVELAADHLKGRRGLTKNDTKAYTFLAHGCDRGDMLGCEMQAKMLRDGRGTKPDPAAALALFDKACQGKSYGACTSMGLGIIDIDKKRAVTLFERACDGDDGLGCMSLGAMYLHGNGVKKDVAKAKTLLSKSCRLGTQSACAKAKTL